MRLRIIPLKPYTIYTRVCVHPPFYLFTFKAIIGKSYNTFFLRLYTLHNHAWTYILRLCVWQIFHIMLYYYYYCCCIIKWITLTFNINLIEMFVHIPLINLGVGHSGTIFTSYDAHRIEPIRHVRLCAHQTPKCKNAYIYVCNRQLGFTFTLTNVLHTHTHRIMLYWFITFVLLIL